MRYIAALAALALSCNIGIAQAQQSDATNWPNRPVRFITPFGAGSGAETLLRVLGERLAKRWGTPAVVESRPGGSTLVAAAAVINASPDGYTFLFTTEDTVTTAQYLEPKPAIDPASELVPVCLVAKTDLSLVTRFAAPFNNLQELVEQAKAKPGSLTIARFGLTGSLHLLAKAFQRDAGISFLSVPYKGIPDATQATLSGEVDLSWANSFAVKGLVESKKLKIVSTSGNKRNKSFPDTPTFAEAGYLNVVVPAYFGMFADKRVPTELIKRLNADIQQVLADPNFQQGVIESRGFTAGGEALDAFQDLLRVEAERRGKLLEN